VSKTRRPRLCSRDSQRTVRRFRHRCAAACAYARDEVSSSGRAGTGSASLGYAGIANAVRPRSPPHTAVAMNRLSRTFALPQVAVEFDTWQDAGLLDQSDSHIGYAPRTVTVTGSVRATPPRG
jgi:hypothetical protein